MRPQKVERPRHRGAARRQLSSLQPAFAAITPFGKRVAELGALAGGYAALGGVVGLIAASVTKTKDPHRDVNTADWIAYFGALLALLGLCVELFALLDSSS